MKTVTFDKWIAPISVGTHGKSAGTYTEFANEHNDCSVRALANCTGISYAESHQIHKSNGRKNRQATNWMPLLNSYQKAHLRIKGIYGSSYISSLASRTTDIKINSGQTVKSFLKKHPKGKYVVIIARHAFAVVDGGIIDGSLVNANSRVAIVWEPKEQSL